MKPCFFFGDHFNLFKQRSPGARRLSCCKPTFPMHSQVSQPDQCQSLIGTCQKEHRPYENALTYVHTHTKANHWDPFSERAGEQKILFVKRTNLKASCGILYGTTTFVLLDAAIHGGTNLTGINYTCQGCILGEKWSVRRKKSYWLFFLRVKTKKCCNVKCVTNSTHTSMKSYVHRTSPKINSSCRWLALMGKLLSFLISVH